MTKSIYDETLSKLKEQKAEAGKRMEHLNQLKHIMLTNLSDIDNERQSLLIDIAIYETLINRPVVK